MNTTTFTIPGAVSFDSNGNASIHSEQELLDSAEEQASMRALYTTDIHTYKGCSPVGYSVLLRLCKTRTQIGSIVVPQGRVKDEDIANIVGEIMAVGPEAWCNADKYPKGAWAKVGDFVVLSSYSGNRIQLEDEPDEEFRVVNDDVIQMRVSAPGLVTRKK